MYPQKHRETCKGFILARTISLTEGTCGSCQTAEEIQDTSGLLLTPSHFLHFEQTSRLWGERERTQGPPSPGQRKPFCLTAVSLSLPCSSSLLPTLSSKVPDGP